MNDPEDANIANTSAIIEAFGGIRPMAHKLDVPVSTVQGWKQRDAIPENRAADILAAAATHNVDLSGISEALSSDGSRVSDSAASARRAPPPPQSPATNPVSDGRKGDRGAFLIAVAALIVSVGVGGWMLLGGGQGDNTALRGDLAQMADRLASLETQAETGAGDTSQQFAADLADLRAELGRIAGVLDENPAPSAKIGELDTRMQAAETKLSLVQRQAASESQTAAGALSVAQDDIAQLRQQLSALGEAGTGTALNVSDAVGLALTTGRLQRAMDKGAPYQDVLVNLRALSAGDAAIGAILDRLTGKSGAGIATRDALTRSFSSVARDVVSAGAADAASGWTDRTLQRIRSVASVRRIGPDVPGDGPDARIARAEAKLRGGDFAGAVVELEGLSGAAATAAANWRDGARARLDADLAVGEIEALAIARLQSGHGGS